MLRCTGFERDQYTFKLLYKSLKDKDDISVFHNKCDNIKYIFIIILTLDNKKFGFYTSLGLSSDQNAVYDDRAFMFKLCNGGIETFHVFPKEIAFYGLKDFILNLGGEQLIIRDKFLSNASFCGLKMKNYRTYNNYEINNGNKNFIIKEMEVYRVIKI